MPDDAPQLTERADQPYAGIAMRVTMETISAIADRIPEIFAWLGARGIAPAGPPFLRYLVIDMERLLTIEAGVPVASAWPVASAEPGGGDVRAGVLPGGRYAVLTHTGAPMTLVAVTAGLLDWAAQAGLAWDLTLTDEGEQWGSRVEFFLTNPAEQPDMSTWQTQLAFRLAD